MKTSILLILILIMKVSVNAQLIYCDCVKINGVLSMSPSAEELVQLGIDSIVPKPEYMETSNPDSLIYFGKSYFTQDKDWQGRKFYSMGNIIFDDKINCIYVNGFKLDRSTTFAELQQILPENCSDVWGVKIHGDDTSYEGVKAPLAGSGGIVFDTSLIFLFSGNLLKGIIKHIPG